MMAAAALPSPGFDTYFNIRWPLVATEEATLGLLPDTLVCYLLPSSRASLMLTERRAWPELLPTVVCGLGLGWLCRAAPIFLL
jgi:hypothetical protein